MDQARTRLQHGVQFTLHVQPGDNAHQQIWQHEASKQSGECCDHIEFRIACEVADGGRERCDEP